jgi:hypothetical protein
LAHGHRLHEELGGQLGIFAPPGDLKISAEQAVRAGVLIIPIAQRK